MALIAGFVLLLLLAFWVIGARNRLMRLRQAVGQAYPPLELQLRKRQALARHLAEAMRHGVHPPREDLEAVLAAAAQAASAIDATRGRATPAAPMRKLASAEEVLADALHRLLPPAPPPSTPPQTLPQTPAPTSAPTSAPADGEALPETVPTDPAVAELQARLLQLHAPLDYARQSYNGHVQRYNAALRVFPTTWVARLSRFDPAAMLPRLSRPA